MTHRITMDDVARKAQVSIMTVSRVINNKDEVSPATRRRVLKIIDSLGYRPSGIARGLATKRTAALGVVVPDIANPFFAGIVRGAENHAYADGYSVFLCNTNEDPARELAVLHSLEEKRIDGLILCASRLSEEKLAVVGEHFPEVVLMLRHLEHDSIHSVLVDDRLGGQILTRHLIRSGHRKIGFLAGPAKSYSGKCRVRGYKAAMKEAGFPVNPQWVVNGAPYVQHGKESARKLLTSFPELTALLCFNDLVAVGAIQACAQLGRSIPQDMAITGFDDIPLASLVTPTLTTCRIPQDTLGESAMQMLLNSIKGSNGTRKKVLIRPELIVRESAPQPGGKRNAQS